MKKILPFICAILFCTAAMAGQTPPPGVQNNVIINAGSQKYGAVALGNNLSITNGFIDTTVDLSSLVTLGAVSTKINSFATNTVYAAGLTTYSSGTYIAPPGPQPIPTTLVADQVYFVNFNQANPGAANLIVGGLPTKPIKIVNSAGAILTLAGGEIVPGPATLYYDGTEFIYSTPGAISKPVAAAVTATQPDFAGKTTFYLTSGAETLTLPCANTLSPNGMIFVFSVSGTATIAKGSTCTDTITKNGTSGTSTTISQGAAMSGITTDGSANFYVSGS